MSVQSQINRLLASKAAIKSAIVGKGQSIGDTDSIDTYADKISAIKITASDDGAGNVTLTMGGTTATYSDGNVTLT